MWSIELLLFHASQVVSVCDQVGILPLENNTAKVSGTGEKRPEKGRPQKKDFIYHDFKSGAYYNIKKYNSLFWKLVGKSG